MFVNNDIFFFLFFVFCLWLQNGSEFSLLFVFPICEMVCPPVFCFLVRSIFKKKTKQKI